MEYFSLDRCVCSWDIDLNTRSLWRACIVVYTLIHIWWLSAPFEMVKSLYLGALYWTNIWIAPFWLNLSSLSVIDIQQLGLNMVSKFANHWDIDISLRTMMKNCLFIFILKFIYIYLYSSGLQEWFIVLLLQSCFVWSTSDYTHQATSGSVVTRCGKNWALRYCSSHVTELWHEMWMLTYSRLFPDKSFHSRLLDMRWL